MQDQRKNGMAAEDGDCVVLVVGPLSDETLCTLQLPRSSTVLHVKRHVQASQRINVFRQRLVVLPAGARVEDNEVLATLPGLRLRLIRLEYADDDAGAGHLLCAAGEGAAPEVEILLNLPLPPDGSQRFEEAPLKCASGRGHLQVVRLLCEAGADKDKADEDGSTALMSASSEGHLDVAQLLCEAGADKDKAKQNGWTALMSASYNPHLQVARLLCEAGADKDKADEEG